MTTRITLEDITNTGCMGWQCDQCHACFPFIEGAFHHQMKIWDKGACPDAPEKEDEP